MRSNRSATADTALSTAAHQPPVTTSVRRLKTEIDEERSLYERRHHPPLSRAAFAWRLVRHAAAALLLMGISLSIGMAGYSFYENLQWRDSFLNAAMLLSGEGPVHIPVTPAGKLFAGLYALYAGLIFLVTAGLLLAPVMHRILHRFHWEDEQGSGKPG